MIPKYHELMLPILRICSDGKGFHYRELANILADRFDLSIEERNQYLSSGKQKVIENRTGWAVFHMKKANLVDRKDGLVSITDDGRKVLDQNPEKIDRKYLLTIPDYVKFHEEMKKNRMGKQSIDEDTDTNQTPDDMMKAGYESMRSAVEDELIANIKSNTPDFFESLVQELLRKMGYGIESSVLGKTGDGGIDGIIIEDKLGMGEIYFQAKRWEGTVPIHHVRDFAGALMAKKSKRGIFITSSNFSRDAYDFIKNIDAKIILIDGAKLTEYMYDYNLGVNIHETYQIKHVDTDYFQ